MTAGQSARPSSHIAGGAMAAGDGREPTRQAVGSTGQQPDPGVARELSELSREMQADTTNKALLQRIVTAAVLR